MTDFQFNAFSHIQQAFCASYSWYRLISEIRIGARIIGLLIDNVRACHIQELLILD